MNYSVEQLHDYASLFSSQMCERALRFADVEELSAVFRKYDRSKAGDKEISTWDYLSGVYRVLKGQYRNEYVYKNELLNNLLLKQVGQSDTIILNEFSVGRSVADIAFFNGCSKAFEIKSELDSDKRLVTQLSDYKKVFEECYIVVPEEQLSRYKNLVDEATGIITLAHTDRGAISLNTERKASRNESVDADILMRSVRTDEYKWMVRQHFGQLPDVSCFEMFEACRKLLGSLDVDTLHRLFNAAVKRRKNRTHNLSTFSRGTRQMCLSLNLSAPKMAQLQTLYGQNINL